MAIYVHITDTCLSEARNQGFDDLIENLKDRVESTQTLVGFEFISAFSLKKKIGKNVRLVARQHLADNNSLILFLRVLTRGSNDYERILRNPDTTVRRFQPSREDEIASILNCRTQGESSIPPRPEVGVRVAHGFWETPSIGELTRYQKVLPITNVEALFGTWPGEENDGFEDAIDKLRHPRMK